MYLGDKQLGLLEKVIDASVIRHKVIANNIANVNTPGYKRLDTSFETELKAALKGSGSSDISSIKPKVVVAKNTEKTSQRNDGNNVNIEEEVSELVKNALSYNVFVQLMSKKFAMLKSAIGGGTPS
ncbi:MAG TPA: flagellar basal body rod protein FlgB [Candidatus Brocadiia bacterium]|nr:flagellar basal body rod protein FlgB [Planctomycetota bacterium]MDO8092231.1 flagellar basal body rod protein FlgB [Candidatus Brocadiales bacterium]